MIFIKKNDLKIFFKWNSKKDLFLIFSNIQLKFLIIDELKVVNVPGIKDLTSENFINPDGVVI